jgi:ribosome maturation factor RimP
MERPLVTEAHFRRFAGRLCRIQTKLPLDGQKRFKGWIGDCTPEAVTLEEDGKLKSVPLAEIQKARLAPFDEAKTPPAKHVKAVLTGPPDSGADAEPESGAVETSPAVEE